MEIYELREDELGEALGFRNAIFTPVDEGHWRAMRCTAFVAREDGRMVGFIPFQFRDQVIRPGVSVPVVYENAVGVADGLRGRGIGTQIIERAALELAGRVHALMVIRGGERSDGYRFYRKTGHGDVLHGVWYSREPRTGHRPAEAVAGGVTEIDHSVWISLEPRLLALHERRCGHFGGGRVRAGGYWTEILEGHVFRSHGLRLSVFRDPSGDVRGYCMAVPGLWRGLDDTYVYELVGEDEHVEEALIDWAARIAGDHPIGFPSVSLANPVRPLLERLGFERKGEIGPQIMARILRPERMFAALAAGSSVPDSAGITVHTPHRSVNLTEPAAPRHRMELWMKEGALTRLLMCRLDLEAAAEMEIVRWDGRDRGLLREVARLLGFVDWIQWYSDYV